MNVHYLTEALRCLQSALDSSVETGERKKIKAALMAVWRLLRARGVFVGIKK